MTFNFKINVPFPSSTTAYYRRPSLPSDEPIPTLARLKAEARNGQTDSANSSRSPSPVRQQKQIDLQSPQQHQPQKEKLIPIDLDSAPPPQRKRSTSLFAPPPDLLKFLKKSASPAPIAKDHHKDAIKLLKADMHKSNMLMMPVKSSPSQTMLKLV